MRSHLRPFAFAFAVSLGLCMIVVDASSSFAAGPGPGDAILNNPANAPINNQPKLPPPLPDHAQGAAPVAAPPVNSGGLRRSGAAGARMSRRGYSSLRGAYAKEAVENRDKLLNNKLKSICRGC